MTRCICISWRLQDMNTSTLGTSGDQHPNIHRIKSQVYMDVYGVLSPAGESSEIQPASRKSPVSSNFSALTSVSTCASSNRGRGESNALRSQQGGQKAQSVLGRKEDVSTTKNRGFFQMGFKMIQNMLPVTRSPSAFARQFHWLPQPIGEPIGEAIGEAILMCLDGSCDMRR